MYNTGKGPGSGGREAQLCGMCLQDDVGVVQH